MAAFPSNLTGGEQGLCIFWRADRTFGARIPHLGSAGATYDAVLGNYAVGVEKTSAVFGRGCNEVECTSPVVENRTGGKNTRPTADAYVTEVKNRCMRWSAMSV